MDSKTDAHLILLSSAQRIDFDVDIEETLPPIDEDLRKFNEAIKEMQSIRIDFALCSNVYQPSGPVVDSTIAGKSEEGQ